ncbi:MULTISPECIES: PTS system mannose/fructose/sorbose family transporter subunit IID [Enterococcus]|uniref:PTS system mannose/fructose/sorbose family transporter subunit IID n=1 Tax=Candidatus Enterococcus ferrettii TaxID=2815324 RepID=A0ABV0ERU2_9ENTE|nr:PTS system mannose/fructose/sorbose family transporter subunit IID [Enterococcus sp. 665A]MBO1341218.1 PTS system mannose/fructose/sorbose family transporter subunit IID [Enterococcus sp. 665A]
MDNQMNEMTFDESRKLTKKDLNKAFIYWTSLAQTTYSWERMQGPAMAGTMIHVMERLYPDANKYKQERKEMMARHMEFYNTEPWLTGPFILAVVLSMEEEKAAGVPIESEDISGMKTGLMGPMAGVGDTLRQATLVPIIGSIAIALGTGGSFFGPIFYMVATLGINYGISYFGFRKLFTKGKEGISEIFSGGLLEKYMTMATSVGAVTIGGLAANTVKLSSSAVINLGANKMVIQELFDKIILGILPLSIIFLTLYLLMKKNLSSTKLLLILVMIAVVGVLIGFI